MIPILFSPSATTYTTNGIGRLSDMISCEVTEERNGIFELTAVVSIDSPHYSSIVHSAIIAAVPYDGGGIQPFRIYKISRPINGKVTINAQHNSYQLSHIPVRPFTASTVSAALAGLKSNSMQTNPFTFWTDKSTSATYTQTKPESIRARLGGQSGSILDVYGGEYEWDGWTVKLWNNRGSDNGVTLRYGKNITDIKQEENIENTITGIVPYWSGGEDEVVYYNGIVSASTASNFPYGRTVVKDFSSDFESAPTAAQLRQRAERYIIRNSIGIPKVSIKVSFIALWQTEEYKDVAPLQRVKLCDWVTIQFEKLGVSAKAKVIKTTYDVLNERYTSIELGEARSDFASYVVGLASQTDQTAEAVASNKNYVMTQVDEKLVTFEDVMNEAIEDATDQIRGANGGNIVTRLNSAGQPYELLIMDNTDIQAARNVWRWNIGGLGYSSTGYNGTYGTAITQSGAIVADYITTGTLTANLIRAGILRDLNNKNSWNLNTGDLTISANGTFGGNLSAAGGTFKGALQAASGTFKGALQAATGTFSGSLSAATGTFKGQIQGGSIRIGGTDASPVFSVDAQGKVTMRAFDLDGTGNAATIGCSVMNVENLRAGTTVMEGDLHMNGGTINAGDIEASTVSAGTVDCGTVSCGTIYCSNPPWESYYDDSDRRLKKNITDISGADALAFIMALSPKKYVFKKDGREATGFIAQDILEVMERLGVDYPLIKEKEDGYLSLNYTNLIALIIAAIQEMAKGA